MQNVEQFQEYQHIGCNAIFSNLDFLSWIAYHLHYFIAGKLGVSLANLLNQPLC